MAAGKEIDLEYSFREYVTTVVQALRHFPPKERKGFSRKAHELARTIISNLDGNEDVVRANLLRIYEDDPRLYLATFIRLCRSGILTSREVGRRMDLTRNGPVG